MVTGEIAFSRGPLTLAYRSCRKRIFHGIGGPPEQERRCGDTSVFSGALDHNFAAASMSQSMRERAGAGETVKIR